MEKVNIMREQWDYLIVLDACRFDYFEKIYKNYMDGTLSKKISVGSTTSEWRDRSFPDRYDDTIYISANPMINATCPVYGYLASEHFYRVYEAWKDCWDEKKGTVLPDVLTDFAVKVVKQAKNKRVIIHYLQPHAPYLSFDEDSKGYHNVDAFLDSQKGIEEYENAPVIKKRLMRYMLRFFKKKGILGDYPDWHIRKWLRLPPKIPFEAALRYAGKKGLRKAYEANLYLVLEQVAILLKHLSGRIIVTSDHGELLGENNCYAHPPGSSRPLQIEVPWLAIEKAGVARGHDEPVADNEDGGESRKPIRSTDNPDEQRELARKLRNLGYYE